MLSYLDKIQPNREKKSSVKKILCIIEGDLEFRYITKIFQLFGYTKGCYELSEEYIKVAWGKTTTPNLNIVQSNCRFNGGSLKGLKVPEPARQAFESYKEDLSIFDSILVFFDGDEDKNNKIENYFKEKFESLEIKNFLLVSIPCFESSLIDFCNCGDCRENIDNMVDEKYPCDKYKNNFSNLNCFNGTKNLITNLNINNIQTLKNKISKFNNINQIISNFMKKNKRV